MSVMEPVWVIFVVCTLSSPASCRDIDGGRVDNVMECMIEGEEQSADWIRRHPGFEFAGVRCVSGDQPPLGEDL